jgi:hypothetical protein
MAYLYQYIPRESAPAPSREWTVLPDEYHRYSCNCCGKDVQTPSFCSSPCYAHEQSGFDNTWTHCQRWVDCPCGDIHY